MDALVARTEETLKECRDSLSILKERLSGLKNGKSLEEKIAELADILQETNKTIRETRQQVALVHRDLIQQGAVPESVKILKPDAPDSIAPDQLNELPLEAVFDKRTCNSLNAALIIKSMRDLVRYDSRTIALVKNIGPVTLEAIEAILKRYGLRLGMTDEQVNAWRESR